MTTHALITPTVPPRRSLCAFGVATDTRRTPPAIPLSVPPEIRTRISAEIRSLLDRADALIDFLNAADAPLLDLEPDTDGEAEPDEASAQPLALAMDRFPPVVHRPSVAQMRRAYRETGAAVPANLRFDIFGRPRA
jgi:hypothetical protein